MAESNNTVKCPLCEGRGELLWTEMVEKTTNPELRKRIEGKVRDFEKDVHTWNPALPIWQRSPKE